MIRGATKHKTSRMALRAEVHSGEIDERVRL